MRYGQNTRDEVRMSVAGVSGAERTTIVLEWAHSLNVHPSTVYRWIDTDHARRRRSRRADKGARRVDVSNEALQMMMALTVRYDMAAEDVIDHAVANRWIAPGAISVATYNRMLGQQHVSRGALTAPGRMDGKLVRSRLKAVPHRRFEAETSNDLHQMDITEMPRYFVQSDGSIGYESPLTFGKNKAGNARPRLQLFGLIDDHSRCAFARFYYGKNALNWIDFCMKAWDAKTDAATFPFCGRPKILYSDNDSAPKSGLFKQFIGDMDVEFLSHQVGNSMAKGKVERLLQTLQGKLLPILRVYIDQDKTVTLSLANDILNDLLYKINYRQHSTTREQPMLRWQSGLPGPARMMPSPEIRERYFYDVAQCLVRADLTIRFGGATWQLPRKEPFLSEAGEFVPVYFHRGHATLDRLIVMVADREYAVESKTVTPDTAGEYKAVPKSDTVRRLEDLYEQNLETFQAGQIYREKFARLMMPAEKEAFDERRVTGPKRLLSPVALSLRLSEDGIDFQPEDVEALYAGGAEILESDYEQIAARLRAVG